MLLIEKLYNIHHCLMIVRCNEGCVYIWKLPVNQYKRIFANDQLDDISTVSQLIIRWEEDNSHDAGLWERADQLGFFLQRVVADVNGILHVLLTAEVVDTGQDGMGVSRDY